MERKAFGPIDKKSNETEGPFSASAFNFSSYGICADL